MLHLAERLNLLCLLLLMVQRLALGTEHGSKCTDRLE